VRVLAAAGAGFLLAVLWFDLMFDVQAGRRRDGDVPPAARASISSYYARVTTQARPMNRLVALAMLVTIGAVAGVWIRGDLPAGRAATALALVAAAVLIAAIHTVPAAVRLGRCTDDAAGQSRLARAIRRDHVVCFALVAAVLLLQLLPA
jgi:hypothetical protein